MNDWKLILKVVVGSVVILGLALWGLSKMASPSAALKVEEKVLLEGARFVKENGEVRVTVVNFVDMQCPVCKAAHEEIKELFDKNGVRMVIRLFPLPATLHKYALISSKAVEAARVMGKGWEMIDLMFEKQEEWSASNKPEELFIQYAKAAGLDEETFKTTMFSDEVTKYVQADLSLANALQLPGTPTIFVNGEQIGSPFVVGKVKELLGEK